MADTFAFDEGIFGFHAQQACEKALKAWLLHLGRNPPHVHDLRALILLLDDAGAIVGEERRSTRCHVVLPVRPGRRQPAETRSLGGLAMVHGLFDSGC